MFSIGYDFHLGNGNNGNVYGITNYKDNNRNQAFTYDSLNRLISAQNAGTDCSVRLPDGQTEYWGNGYAYDTWGNLLQKNVTKCMAENMTVTADTHNWIHTGAAPDYNYDAAGNMTSDPTDGVSMSYDAENRIATATKNGVVTTYTYDADGNRVKKTTGTGGTLYWYMVPGIVAESDISGTLKSEYVFFDGERVARKDFPGNAVFYYFSDHLKTASVVTDSAGHITDESDYYPWGGELQFANSGTNHYKFTGKERDSETGLDYFGARYYSNGLGRWVTPDMPFADQHLQNPQSWNLYMYAGNRPTSLIDTDGREVKETRTTTYYSVSGSTANEAMQNANANGPNGHAGMTTPIIGADYSFSSKVSPSTNGNVTVTDTVTKDTVNLQQTIELPKWDGRDKASPEEQKTWDSAASDLQKHENTHADQNRESADALDKSLPGTKASATGKPGDKEKPPGKAAEQKLNGAVQDKIDNTVKDMNQKANKLDERTHHGTVKEPQ